MTSTTPDYIGKYRIEKQLGEGGMGVVYQGFDEDIQRRVAIKTLHPHLISESQVDDYQMRFRREAQAAAQCTHPNIVAVLEYGQTDRPYIVMEFVEGRSLDDLLKRQVFTLKQVLTLASDSLKALHHAHQSGIVHRDIKPANIMVTRDGHAKLTDFGIAKLTQATGITRVGLVLGTPDYISPEQARGYPTDARSDLYSLALVLFEMLCQVDLPESIPLARLPRTDSLPLSGKIDFSTPIVASMVSVIQKALAANPESRMDSAREFMQGLKHAVDHVKAPQGLDYFSRRTDVTRISDQPEPAGSYQDDEQATSRHMAVGDARPEPTTGSMTMAVNALSGIDESTLLGLKDSLSSMIDGDINALIQVHAAKAISLAELIYALSDEIASRRHRKRFLAQWDMQ